MNPPATASHDSPARVVRVIGAGLAGSEAAWQLAEAGVAVELHEMRPVKMTEAHTTAKFAELVCSNSFGSDTPHHASHILKEELRVLGAFVLSIARKHQVPAGSSLAVDRETFASEISETLSRHPKITIHHNELCEIPPNGITIVATGPLTSASLCRSLADTIGTGSLYFYDAISPIVSAESLDFDKLFFANRWGKGDSPDFLNLPLTQEQYNALVDDLLTGDCVLPHEFEEEKYFEGCMPIEAIAARGRQTLAFGPLRPVGLNDPKTGKRAHAVIQLRTENKYKTAYNLVGFQTKLKYKEQERIFRKLPGLENAEFLRLGSMHRNTYLDSPRVLTPGLALKKRPEVFIAGQLTGTEGYLESTATGYVAARNALNLLQGKPEWLPPAETMLGSLLRAITDESKESFQPINSNLGILPPAAINFKKDKAKRNAYYAEVSQLALRNFSGPEPRPQL